MVKKIDDSTMVPLTWLAAILITAIGATATVAIFANRVDIRLSRIEEKLNLPPLSSSAVVYDANAASK